METILTPEICRTPTTLERVAGHVFMSSYTSKPLHKHLPLDECAAMFGSLFTGTLQTSLQPNHLAQEPWTLRELMGTVKKFKLNTSADESGVVPAVFPASFAAKIP